MFASRYVSAQTHLLAVFMQKEVDVSPAGRTVLFLIDAFNTLRF